MAEAVDEEPLFADDLDEYEEEDEEDPPPLPPPVLGVQSATQPLANSRNTGDTTPQRNNSASGIDYNYCIIINNYTDVH